MYFTLGNSMSNSYRKIEIGNHKYLMLNLDYNVREETKDWANKVISENPDYKVIVSMHAYLTTSGACYVGSIGSSDVNNSYTQEIAFNGKALWDDIFSKHSNVFMIYSGHVSIEDPLVQTRKGDNGNEVIEILVDPQAYDAKDPSGFVLMLNFMDGGSKIEFEYYSPSKKAYFKDKNQFSMTLPEGTLPKYVPTAAVTEATTEAEVTTAEVTTEAVTEAEKSGCGSAIGSTLAVACTLGTSLAAFAMRKKKED